MFAALPRSDQWLLRKLGTQDFEVSTNQMKYQLGTHHEASLSLCLSFSLCISVSVLANVAVCVHVIACMCVCVCVCVCMCVRFELTLCSSSSLSLLSLPLFGRMYIEYYMLFYFYKAPPTPVTRVKSFKKHTHTCYISDWLSWHWIR